LLAPLVVKVLKNVAEPHLKRDLYTPKETYKRDLQKKANVIPEHSDESLLLTHLVVKVLKNIVQAFFFKVPRP